MCGRDARTTIPAWMFLWCGRPARTSPMPASCRFKIQMLNFAGGSTHYSQLSTLHRKRRGRSHACDPRVLRALTSGDQLKELEGRDELLHVVGAGDEAELPRLIHVEQSDEVTMIYAVDVD